VSFLLHQHDFWGMVRHNFSDYVLQIGRSVQDREEGLRIHFVNETENFQVIHIIEDFVIPSGAATDILIRVVESTAPGGRSSFSRRA